MVTDKQIRAELKTEKIFSMFLMICLIGCVLFLGVVWKQTTLEVRELAATRLSIEQKIQTELGRIAALNGKIDGMNDKMDAIVGYTRP